MCPVVSVIIVSYNSSPLLIECVQAALASTIAIEILVSDNGSTDFSIDALECMARDEPRLRVLRNGANLGFAAGNNVALPLSSGSHVLFLNPDCLIRPDLLEALIKEIEKHPEVGMAGCTMRDSQGREDLNARRRIPDPWSLLRQFIGFNQAQLGALSPCSEPYQVEAISGAFMLVRRAALTRIGSFDERFFMHWEDLDLCKRFALAGQEILFVPSMEVVHWKGRSSINRPIRVEWYKHIGMLRFLHKYHFPGVPFSAFAFAAFPVWLRLLAKIAIRPRPLCYNLPEISDVASAKTVWIFGATSLVGECLVPRLVSQGNQVIAFSRQIETHSAGPHLRWVKCDLGAPDISLPNGTPDLIISLAPLDVAARWLGQLTGVGAKCLIAFSTTSVLSKADSPDGHERAFAQKYSDAEATIVRSCEQQKTIAWVILRPTMIYTWGHDKNITRVARVINTLRIFPVLGEGKGKRRPVHAQDLACAVIQLMASNSAWNQAYTLSGRDTMTYRQMVEKIYRRLGLSPRIVSLPRACWRIALLLLKFFPSFRGVNLEMVNRMNSDLDFDHADAAVRFGYEPRPFSLF